ncbi:hypothetical protein QUF07_07810 [Lentilactobacillus sp. TOM.63]|nr:MULTISPECIES: hypothetical protein [Lentilactobacillus]MDM7516618.1 hypothetical protein [Lentilactobacillus sp. TOM.63]
MQPTSTEDLILYKQIQRDKQAEQKQATVKLYGMMSMMYMYLGA